MTCPEMKKHLAERVFESRPLPDEARKHIAECEECAAELAGMESTWKLLDEWQAPEPSAFFDAKLYARLRVEQTIPPASFFNAPRRGCFTVPTCRCVLWRRGPWPRYW